MPHTRLRPSFTFTEERLAELRAVVPEAFADGKINWETLREALGDWLEPDEADAEHFGLFWPGKREARRLAAMPSRGTLVPVPGEGVDEVTTRNLFIEGDNLEVLKLLQKSYAGRVKMIYIDPPYNTGNDFVYKDDFRDPLGDYLRKTGQADEAGQPLTTNTRAEGRFHSNWLSMMYPRLRLARQLLSDDGLLFVSIDDNEVANLRLLLNEIFGDEGFIAQLVWKSRKFPDARAVTGVSVDHEYLLVYARNLGSRVTGTERDEAKFTNPDNDPRGPWMSRSILGLATASQRPNLHFEIVDPATGRRFLPPSNTGWRYNRERIERLIAEGCILFPTKPDGRPREKKFRADMKSDHIGLPSVLDGIHTSDGTAAIRSLFQADVFDFPKPPALMQLLLEQALEESGTVLDLFAGSATLAEAVLELNREKGKQIRYIGIQLQESASHESFSSIASIGEERTRRVIERLRRDSRTAPHEDLGLRVLELAPSHFEAWQNFHGDVGQLEARFEEAESPLVKGWTPEALTTEIILLQGFPLDACIEPQSALKKNEVRLVTADGMAHRLWICLDKHVHPATVAATDVSPEDVFVCFDTALDDEMKLRLADRCSLETI